VYSFSMYAFPALGYPTHSPAREVARVDAASITLGPSQRDGAERGAELHAELDRSGRIGSDRRAQLG
jgi:hypothetical protein